MATIVDPDEYTADEEATKAKGPEEQLVDWIVGKTDVWRDARNEDHQTRWEEYYRLWRGIWAAEDKTRGSERSRLITPALQQAIESVTSEIESAILDKAQLFDIVDKMELGEQSDPRQVEMIRKQLQKDMEWADVQCALNEMFLIGSIFGTGIGKIVSGDVDIPAIGQGMQGPEVVTETRTKVELMPILPGSFLIDPSANSIDTALGCAHEYYTPRHEVLSMQSDGVYRDAELCAAPNPVDPIESDEEKSLIDSDGVNIIDYQGLVPASLLRAVQPLAADEEQVDLFPEEEDEGAYQVDYDEDDLVEAFITVANGGTLLKAVENPSLLKERLFVAYRHEIVPDQFWGRGVAEKGYNSQKALDASMRARIDGLALTVHPMMGVDAGKMPRGFRFKVAPGKTILTNGDPQNILRPMNFGNIDPNVFTNNSELERYVTLSTGGSDTAAPITVNGRNETAAGMSMQMGSMVKRAKRTIRNIERELMLPLVSKMHRLYMQLEPQRYPALDVTYEVKSVLGTMARELEQQQFANMLNTVEANSPAFWMLLRSIYETSSLSNRETMLPLIEQQMQQALQPQPDPMVELKREEIKAKIAAERSRIQVEYIRAQAEIARAANDARTADSEEAKNESQAILNLAKAQAEVMGSDLSRLQAQLDMMERESTAERGLAEEVIRNVYSTATMEGAE